MTGKRKGGDEGIMSNEQRAMSNEEGQEMSDEQRAMSNEETPDKDIQGQAGERDYTRKPYMNFMAVHRVLEANAPLPLTQKQIQETTGVSKNMVFDICWNMVAGGWAEDTGNGGLRLKGGANDKEAYIGRMVLRLVRDAGMNQEKE